MPRPPRELPVPSAVVPALLRYLAARGSDPALITTRLGLADDAIDRDLVDVAPRAIGDLIEAAAVALGEPYLALRLPAELPLRRYTLAELAARAAPTLRESLQRLDVHPQMTPELGYGEYRLTTPAHPRGVGRHATEYALAYVVTHTRAVLGEPLPIERVWFAHARPRELVPLERFFGTRELEFGTPESGFAFPPALVDRALVTADPRLAATVAELAPAPPVRTNELAPRVAAYVRAQLPEAPVADAAAAALHMSARTLQRRLEAEGTSFTTVVDATREAIARELLVDRELPLAEVAYRLGFADLATFSRAFKRWTGTSPGRFRVLASA